MRSLKLTNSGQLHLQIREDLIIIQYILLAVLLILAVAGDMKTYKIRNELILTALAAGLAANLLTGGWPAAANALLAALLPLLLLIALYALRMLGAGDIKLFCAVGAIVGAPAILLCMAFSFLAGGVIALAVMAFRGNFGQRSAHLLRYFKTCFLTRSLQPYTDFQDRSDGAKFPFSLTIACGVLLQALTGTS